MVSRIVITGAPASGKSECINRLKQDPAFAAYLFFDEIARRLLQDNPHIRNDWMAFHLEIYRCQSEREKAEAGRSFITDRGTLDAFAFHPSAMDAVGTTISREYLRYDLVVHLGSAARLGEEFYQKDAVRTETTDEALRIESALREVWSGHPQYRFVPAHSDYEQKFVNLLTILENHERQIALDKPGAAASL